MKYLTFLTVAGFALFLGCAPGQMMNGEEENGQWEATLTPQAGLTGATGQAEVTVLDWGASATASLEGAEQAGTHGWHVHRGQCGDQGEIVGEAETYPALEVGDDGSGEATAMVDESLNSGDDYYIDVHPDLEDTETVIACGDLTRAEGMQQQDPDDQWTDTMNIQPAR